jgi:hypothetical protein
MNGRGWWATLIAAKPGEQFYCNYRDRVTVGGEGCRTVTVKKRMPDGSVVIRRKSSC